MRDSLAASCEGVDILGSVSLNSVRESGCVPDVPLRTRDWNLLSDGLLSDSSGFKLFSASATSAGRLCSPLSVCEFRGTSGAAAAS